MIVKLICNTILIGTIGEGFPGQKFTAKNLGIIVSIYLKNCKSEIDSLNAVAEWYKAMNDIEDYQINKWHSLLKKKTIGHFIKPMLQCVTTLYNQQNVEKDLQLSFHQKCIAHFNELTKIIQELDEPKLCSYLFNYATVLFNKSINKIRLYYTN